MFKHITIGKKIVLGFTSVLILLIMVGLISYQALSSASDGFMHYREMARDTNLAGRLQVNMLMVRMKVKDYIITGKEQNIKGYESYWQKVAAFQAEAQKEIQHPERAAKIDAIEAQLKNYNTGFTEVVKFMGLRDKQVNDVLNIKGPFMENTLTDIMVSASEDNDMTASYHSGLAMKHLLLGRLYMAKFLDTNNQKNRARTHEEFGKMQEKLILLDKELENPNRRKMLSAVMAAKNEYINTFDELVKSIEKRNLVITKTLDRIGPEIAGSIEDVKLSIKAVQDELGPKLVASNKRSNTLILIIGSIAVIAGCFLSLIISRGITNPLNRVIVGLSEGSSQVASASNQIASASQALAEGSSQQAASIEETSSSLEEISSMIKKNSENSDQADKLMTESNQIVKRANSSMEHLTLSMEEISKAGSETSKIIKTIDEIAFQTNLLALNAAVEAARAGEAGAGFAVVAEEVRNLAMRSADAAKNTAELIEGTVKKVSDGTDLVNQTNHAFTEVAESSLKVGELISEISAASREQSTGIEQVNTAVNEIDKVIQQNASNAEESASASEEMNAQAVSMQDVVSELRALVNSARSKTFHREPPGTLPKATHMLTATSRSMTKFPGPPRKGEVRPDQVIPFDGDGFTDF